MKTTLIFFAICVTVSISYQFAIVKSPVYYVPLLNFRGSQSIVHIPESNNHNILINSLILQLYTKWPVVVSSATGYNNTTKGLENTTSNVLIFIEHLNEYNLRTLPLERISPWSHLFVIITIASGNETCENGKLSKSLFENAQVFMNTIWHIYRIMRVTVSFPYTCPNHYIIYSGKKPSNTDLYDRTIKLIKASDTKEFKAHVSHTNLHKMTDGYPLRANIFYRFPTSIMDCDGINNYVKINYNFTNGYCGMDGIVMNEFVKYFQYNVSIPNDKRCNDYGFVIPDTGDVTGVLGCIVRGQVDISFNSRFMVHYATDVYNYLHYVGVDSLAVVLRRPELRPLWHYAYNIFTPTTATTLCILIIILGIVTWVWMWVTREISKQKPKKIHVYIVNALICTLFGIPIERGSGRFRVLRATSLVCSILLMTFYQGNVSKHFTTRTRIKELKTLQELYQSKFLLYTSPSIKDLVATYANPNDKTQMEYLNRTKLKSENISTSYVVDHPEAATLVRGTDVQIEVLLNYTDEHGSPMIYKIDETFHMYLLSYIARPGFPFVEESIRFMLRLLEAGLSNRYYIWTQQTIKMGDTSHKYEIEPRDFTKTKLTHLRIAFCVLGFGYIVSTCSFLVEKYMGKLLKSRNSSQFTQEILINQ